MAGVHGTCDERFSAVREALARNLDRRLTISYRMNRMAPGILGSDRSEAYVRAAYGALR